MQSMFSWSKHLELAQGYLLCCVCAEEKKHLKYTMVAKCKSNQATSTFCGQLPTEIGIVAGVSTHDPEQS